MLLYAHAETTSKAWDKGRHSPDAGEPIRPTRARSKEARCLGERVSSSTISECGVKLSATSIRLANKAYEVKWEASAITRTIEREYERGVISRDEMESLIVTDDYLWEQVEWCNQAATRAALWDCSRLEFCKVRATWQHKTSLEILNAPRRDSQDIIETSLEVRTTSLHAHAPPQLLTTHKGAAQVT